MSDLVNIGSAAVNAYQRALATVSNNIANIGTDGYTRQEVALQSSTPEHRGQLFFGTGVSISGIKRAYDEFAVGNLRDSYSSLNTQGPLLDYANRVIDIMGSEQSGLQPAMDSFFGSARQLSAAPASGDARDKFLRTTDGLAVRFRTLSNELGNVESDTRTAIGNDVQRLNTLSRELAAVNQRLMAQNDLERQPAELLDERDRLLVEMSKIAGIRVETALNGEVTVGLGATTRQSTLVSGKTSRDIGATFSDSDAGKVDILLDPYGNATAANSLSGGTLAGLLSFRQQVLQPAQARLDALAQNLVDGVNRVHAGGIDVNGQPGTPLLAVDPLLKFQAPASYSNVWVDSQVIDPTQTAYHDIELRWFEDSGIWRATDLSTGKQVFGKPGSGELVINGTRLTVSGKAQAAENILMKAVNHPAASIRLALKDPQQVAAGALFRAIPAPGNVSTDTPEVIFDGQPAPLPGPHPLDGVLVNNPNPSAAVSFSNSPGTALGAIAAIPAGFSDTALLLANAPGADVDLQVLTGDGRHLLGKPLDDSARQRLLDPGNGFAAGATYSDQYLNAQGDAAYRGIQMFYGARAAPGRDPVFDAENKLVDTRTVRAHLDGMPLPPSTLAAGQTYIAAGALTLNGRSLAALTIPAGGHLQAADIAAWLNAQVPAGTDVQAVASNDISIPAGQARLGDPSSGLRINGRDFVPGPGGFANVDQIAAAINGYAAVQPSFGVTARVTPEGVLVLGNAAGQAGEDIDVGTPLGMNNALGLSPRLYRASLVISSDQPLQIGIGAQGHAADLSRLGLRAGAYVDGVAPEDLLVFATGTGDATVASAYRAGELDPLQAQRNSPLDIVFDSASHYTIKDARSGAVLAERNLDGTAREIRYGNLTVRFSTPPLAGDRFRVDGNQDGIANNENMLRIAALETSTDAFPGNRTLAQDYQGLIGSIGNVASQAQVARDALQVVNEQAIQTREQASGVSLDTEAADLIRFQQAYQAAARSIQVGTQLFDAIAQIR